MVTSKGQPIAFREAFTRVILHRTGLTVSERELHQELLDLELESTKRLDGFSGDAEIAGREELPDERAASSTGKGKEPSGKGKGKGVKSEALVGSGGWSDNAEELLALVKRLGPRNPNLCSALFLKPFFRDLKLPELSLGSLGEDLWKFTKLTSLDVSRNLLTELDQLPPNIRIFKAYNNRLRRVTCKPAPSLIFLGLGHNLLGKDGLDDITKRFPNLLSLDLSHTEIVSLDVDKFRSLSKLKHLVLTESPVCLLPFYRLTMLRELPLLQALDGIVPSDEETADAQLSVGVEPVEVEEPKEEEEAKDEEVKPSPHRPGAGGKGWLRLRVELGKLSQHVGLLTEALMPEGPTEAELEAAQGNEEEELEPKDPLSERVGQEGALRIAFQLPSGVWVTTTPVSLAKKYEEEPEEDEPPPPVVLKEIVKFGRVKQEASGEHLSFELDLDLGGLKSRDATSVASSESVGLLELQRWLHKGMPMKLWYIPPPPKPPAPPEDAEEAEAAAEGEEAAEVVPATPPPEVAIGGCVMSLAVLLRRGPETLAESARGAGQLPVYPAPWQHSEEVQLVPMAHWLHPETQVPSPDPPKKAMASARTEKAALLEVVATVYAEAPPAEEPPESEEEVVGAAAGKAKAKKKAKAKPKK